MRAYQPAACDDGHAAARLVHPAVIGEQRLERVLQRHDDGYPHHRRVDDERYYGADWLLEPRDAATQDPTSP